MFKITNTIDNQIVDYFGLMLYIEAEYNYIATHGDGQISCFVNEPHWYVSNDVVYWTTNDTEYKQLFYVKIINGSAKDSLIRINR